MRGSQFFEILDVVKNVLLVPPPLELRSKAEERRAAGCIDSEKVRFYSLAQITWAPQSVVGLARSTWLSLLNLDLSQSHEVHITYDSNRCKSSQ